MAAIALAAILIFSGCAPQPITQTIPAQVSDTSTPQPTATQASTATSVPTATAAALSPSASPTAAIPAVDYECDEAYCIVKPLFPFIYPINDVFHLPVDPSYPFGSSQTGKRDLHTGVEFQNKAGTPVRAVADGQVVFAGSDKDTKVGLYYFFYGNTVIIQHQVSGREAPVYTLYGHLLELNVRKGQKVKAGTVVGKVGQSGSATGSHLHFEVRPGENDFQRAVNPVLMIQPFFDKIAGIETGTLVVQGDLSAATARLGYNLEKLTAPGGITYGITYDEGTNTDAVIRDLGVSAELRPGRYLFKISYSGRVYPQEIVIESGKMTLVPLEILLGKQ